MYRIGDKVMVEFDLAEKCPFLGEAPVRCPGTVKSDNGKTVRVYVDAKYGRTEYMGPVDVPQDKVSRRDAR